eukprot:s1741_g13.t1
MLCKVFWAFGCLKKIVVIPRQRLWLKASRSKHLDLILVGSHGNAWCTWQNLADNVNLRPQLLAKRAGRLMLSMGSTVQICSDAVATGKGMGGDAG